MDSLIAERADELMIAGYVYDHVGAAAFVRDHFRSGCRERGSRAEGGGLLRRVMRATGSAMPRAAHAVAR